MTRGWGVFPVCPTQGIATFTVLRSAEHSLHLFHPWSGRDPDEVDHAYCDGATFKNDRFQLGKTSTARAAIAALMAADGLSGRRVIYAVPRHNLGLEQVVAFQALGLRAMLWKGRGAPDPPTRTRTG